MKIRLGGMSQCFFSWLLYCQYSVNQAERSGLARCWQGLGNFTGKTWGREEASRHHLGLCGRSDSYSGGRLLALTELFSTVLQLTQAGEVLVAEVV